MLANQGLVFLSRKLLSTQFVRERIQEGVMRRSLLNYIPSYADRNVADRCSAMRGRAEVFSLTKEQDDLRK